MQSKIFAINEFLKTWDWLLLDLKGLNTSWNTYECEANWESIFYYGRLEIWVLYWVGKEQSWFSKLLPFWRNFSFGLSLNLTCAELFVSNVNCLAQRQFSSQILISEITLTLSWTTYNQRVTLKVKTNLHSNFQIYFTLMSMFLQ